MIQHIERDKAKTIDDYGYTWSVGSLILADYLTQFGWIRQIAINDVAYLRLIKRYGDFIAIIILEKEDKDG